MILTEYEFEVRKVAEVGEEVDEGRGVALLAYRDGHALLLAPLGLFSWLDTLLGNRTAEGMSLVEATFADQFGEQELESKWAKAVHESVHAEFLRNDRSGGFGGAHGLARYLEQQRFDLLIDRRAYFEAPLQKRYMVGRREDVVTVEPGPPEIADEERYCHQKKHDTNR